MTTGRSDLDVEAFRKKLISVCDEDTFSMSFIPPIFELFSSNKKYFYGIVKDRTFKLKRNSRLYLTSYMITGSFSVGENGTTAVSFLLKPIVFFYYYARIVPLLGAIVFGYLLLSDPNVPRTVPVLVIGFLTIMSFVVMAIDKYRGRKMIERFILMLSIQLPENEIELARYLKT